MIKYDNKEAIIKKWYDAGLIPDDMIYRKIQRKQKYLKLFKNEENQK